MRKFIINVNGNSYEVEVEEVTSGASAPRKPASVTTPKVADPTPNLSPEPKPVKTEVQVVEGQEVVESPMPGNIWKVLVSEGDMVKAGDILLILEAMKMENEILAPRDGKVVSISVSEGSVVNTGDKLVIID